LSQTTGTIDMSEQIQNRRIATLYAVTIFLSAFLLFQVQPLLGKFILPWFGGSPAVWTTCMLVFQVLLFAGYAYAHATTQFLTPRKQVLLHIGLLIVACCLLPIAPDASWKPSAQDTPVWRIIFLTICSVGVPYFILSSTGPLVQSWFSRTLPHTSPYRLYSLSNLGSLIALLSYPFVFEPSFATPVQAILWSGGFALFAVLCACCAATMWRGQTAANQVNKTHAETVQDMSSVVIPPGDLVALWFGLAMLPSVLLLAITNQVCLDVAVIPFLWVLPLALYLVTFILAFDATGWYSRKWYSLAAAVAIALTCMIMFKQPGEGLLAQLVIYFSTLFCCCMVCHGELVNLKPHPRFLTKYYLTISAGGAAGGLFVGLLAPVIFTGYYELHLAFVGFGLLYLAVKTREEQPLISAGPRWAQRLGSLGVLFTVGLLLTQLGSSEGNVAVARNFYGVLRVREVASFNPKQHRRELVHGRIVHGSQFLAPTKRYLPTTYYGFESGIGRILNSGQNSSPQRVGVIGLGIGSLTSYANTGDEFRFYEINPDVILLAQRHFSCLKDCRGQVEIITGDARLVLEHEAPQAFDVLVLDAFSGDAIPVHLLTREAWQVYLKHMKPDGILACHISNLHFDLRPVLAGLADEFHLSHRIVISSADPDSGTQTAFWCLMSRDPAALDARLGEDSENAIRSTKKILWTDDRSNLLEVLR
jgi:hypothetical protein